MPQLSSGRHVAISASPYLDALSSEPDDSRYFAILALRVHANSPQALRDHLVIGYFIEGQGTPPDAPSYNSGYCVADVLEGRSDWSEGEIEEFRQFLDEPRTGAWLQAQFDEIDDAIKNNPVWGSALLANDGASGEIDVPMLKRAVIQRSVLEWNAMEQLRGAEARRLVEADSPADSHPSSVAVQSVRQPELPDELRDLILSMAHRSDVHSVSCQFGDERLWRGLLEVLAPTEN